MASFQRTESKAFPRFVARDRSTLPPGTQKLRSCVSSVPMAYRRKLPNAMLRFAEADSPSTGKPAAPTEDRPRRTLSSPYA